MENKIYLIMSVDTNNEDKNILCGFICKENAEIYKKEIEEKTKLLRDEFNKKVEKFEGEWIYGSEFYISYEIIECEIKDINKN